MNKAINAHNNANLKSEKREIKAKKERENLNKSMFLSLY